MRIILLLLLLCPLCVAECYRPHDLEHINHSVVFCSDTFDAPNGIFITNNNIAVDCNSAVIRGDKGKSNTGITIINTTNITLLNCNVATYSNGIMLKNVTFSTISGNNLLKNDVGIRLFDSFENNIVKNNDKSLIKSISAINSKYNVVTLGNKGVDAGFCDYNSCNKAEKISPCVNDDGYCSPNCDASNDDDCAATEAPAASDTRSADDIIDEIKRKTERPAATPATVEEPPREREATPTMTKLAIYAAFFATAFLIIQFYLYRQKR